MYTGELHRGTIFSAGYDLKSTEKIIIPAGLRHLVPTGVRLALLPNQFGNIRSRSSLAVRGIDTGAGVVDSDYSGEVKVLLINNSTSDFAVEPGMRVAQIIIQNYETITASVVPVKQGTHDGFGSTGLF
jgi:dUTP pyrophosphatase